VNHTRFPKENHLPYWARRGNKDKKVDRVDLSAVVAWVLYATLCDVCYCIVLYCTVLYCVRYWLFQVDILMLYN